MPKLKEPPEWVASALKVKFVSDAEAEPNEMPTLKQNAEDVTEQNPAPELEKVREEERKLRRELESLMPERAAASGSVADEAGRVCRQERLREELLPRAHGRKLELEAEIARQKARALAEEAEPSRRRLEEARAELEAARREWENHEPGLKRARWQAERLDEQARRFAAR